jgi:hypothetical protein
MGLERIGGQLLGKGFRKISGLLDFGRFSRGAGNVAGDVGSGSFRNIGSRFGNSVSGFVGNLNKPISQVPKLKYGLGALGIGAVGKSIWDYIKDNDTKVGLSGIPAGPSYADLMFGGPSQADVLKELYTSPVFSQQMTAPNYEGLASEANQRAMASLNDYLNTLAATGQVTGQDIANAYQEFSKDIGNYAEAEQVRGQDLAATIDRLYQDLGLSQAELAAGGGTSAEPSMVGDLAPMGGEMATAQQTTPTYGATLADYLGAESTAAANALQQQALSTAEQGAGTASGLLNMINLAAAQQRFAAEQNAADRIANARLADLDYRNQMEANRIAREQEQAVNIWQAGREDDRIRRESQNVVTNARSTAAYLWDTAEGKTKQQLEKAYGKGVAGKSSFLTAVTMNPNLITRFGG